MDWFSYLVAGAMVYVAVAVFAAGMVYRVYQWLSVPQSSVRLGIFPKPKGMARWLGLLKDSFIFPQVIEVDGWMWFFVILFHLALLGAFFGHLRLIRESPLTLILGSEGMDKVSFLGGASVGVVLTLALLYYLIRRFASPYKELSVPEDYLLVILILLIVTMGNHMRFIGHVSVEDYRAYVQSLLAFKPNFPDAIAASSTKWSLTLHVFFSNLLLLYFPFSKLTHAIGTFLVNLVRSD